MKLFGDPNKSDKFYVFKQDGSIEWVPNVKLAKQATEDVNNKIWYNQNVYATNERIVQVDNKLYPISKAPKQSIEIHYNNYNNFCNNASDFSRKQLEECALNLGYNSYLELISWKDSKIKEYKDLAKQFIVYRDEIYNYLNTKIKENKKVLSDEKDPKDFTNLYIEFINNFPKFKKDE